MGGGVVGNECGRSEPFDYKIRRLHPTDPAVMKRRRAKRDICLFFGSHLMSKLFESCIVSYDIILNGTVD